MEHNRDFMTADQQSYLDDPLNLAHTFSCHHHLGGHKWLTLYSCCVQKQANILVINHGSEMGVEKVDTNRVCVCVFLFRLVWGRGFMLVGARLY